MISGDLGTGELISGALVTGIGAKHNKSGAQVTHPRLPEIT